MKEGIYLTPPPGHFCALGGGLIYIALSQHYMYMYKQ